MAKIICTKSEFNKYIGPRIRNVIQAMTKKKKKGLNHICEKCKSSKELEAAHIRESSRKDFIEALLTDYIVDKENSLVEVDLEKFEKDIMKAHQPLDKYFKFLCSRCHLDYDRGNWA